MKVQKPSNNAIIGMALIGLGAGLAAAGCAILVPMCASWSQAKVRDAYRKGKEGVLSGFEGAAATLKDVADKAQGPLSDAAKAARQTTAIAAGAVETAAHYVREHIQ
jgi:hypothetical protein